MAALVILHDHNIAHGDLYGHNIRYTPSGDATLMDLGGAWRFAAADGAAVRTMELRAYIVLASELFARVARRERVREKEVAAFLAGEYHNASAVLRWLSAYGKKETH